MESTPACSSASTATATSSSCSGSTTSPFADKRSRTSRRRLRRTNGTGLSQSML